MFNFTASTQTRRRAAATALTLLAVGTALPFIMKYAIIPVQAARPEPRALVRDLPDHRPGVDPVITAGIHTAKRQVRVVLPAYFPLE
jgi:hypothetical protein